MSESSFLTQVWALARRSTVRTLRQPAVIISALLFPMMFFSINASGLDAASRIPGFPTDSYLDFAFAFPLVQASLFGAITAGSDLARDIESGFFDRLSLTPMRPVALLGGMLAGVVALGLVQAVVYLATGLAVGVDVEAGIAGAVVLLALSALYALGFGAVGTFMALRTGSGESIQGLFPLLFFLLFISSVNMPRNLMEVDWFRAVASANPVSYMVEGIRSLIITGWDAQAVVLATVLAFALIAVGLGASALSLKTRLTRT